MKNRRQRAKQVRRRKVVALASYCRLHTVNNCTIPKVDESNLIDKKVPWGTIKAVNGNSEWKVPKEGFKQIPRLRKKYKKKYYCKGSKTEIRKVIEHPSDYDNFPNHTFYPKGKAWYMEELVKHKMEKWERKNPCPVKPDSNPPDMFEEEFIVPWKQKRETALERFRDFVVSIYDKLPLTGRFEHAGGKYTEEKVAEIKDVNMEGHNINKLDPNKSKLLKVAKKTTNKVHAKRSNLVCTNLKDHRRQKGRIILPDYKQAA